MVKRNEDGKYTIPDQQPGEDVRQALHRVALTKKLNMSTEEWVRLYSDQMNDSGASSSGTKMVQMIHVKDTKVDGKDVVKLDCDGEVTITTTADHVERSLSKHIEFVENFKDVPTHTFDSEDCNTGALWKLAGKFMLNKFDAVSYTHLTLPTILLV